MSPNPRSSTAARRARRSVATRRIATRRIATRAITTGAIAARSRAAGRTRRRTTISQNAHTFHANGSLRARNEAAIDGHAGVIDALLTTRTREFTRLARRSAYTQRAFRSRRTWRGRVDFAVAIVIETVANIERWLDATLAFERSIHASPRSGFARGFVIRRHRQVTRRSHLGIVCRAASRNALVDAYATRTRTCIRRARISIIALAVGIATPWLVRMRARIIRQIAHVDRAQIRVRTIGVRLTTSRNCAARTRSTRTRTLGRRTEIALRAIKIVVATAIDQRMRTHATRARTDIGGAQVIVDAIGIRIATPRNARMAAQSTRRRTRVDRTRIAIIAIAIRYTAIRNLRMHTRAARHRTKIRRTCNAIIAISILDTTSFAKLRTRTRHRNVRHDRRQESRTF